jgi:L-lactate dehydrogenase complex protein LldF
LDGKNFYKNTVTACADRSLSQKLQAATDRQSEARRVICEELDDVEKFRDLAAELRNNVLSNLHSYLSRFVENIEQAGVNVHWAKDAEEGREIVCRVAKDQKVTSIVKSKSMITEEIGVTDALEGDGLEVTETDLGEFIVQISGQKPAHIVLPAIHLSSEEVAQIFAEKIGYCGEADPQLLTKAARNYLRAKFKAASMGISGVNFAVAEQGLWTTCTNEGNGRYVMEWPKVYVAIMGIERIVQDANCAAVILKLLARFATGQRITQYTNLVKSPGSMDRPEHVHLVLLDNGRSRILASKYWQMLRCIRCGACLNVCPVFRHIGGQSFPSCYSGPMGTVLSPLLMGLKSAGTVPKACSICGICNQTCPVKVPLTDLLLELRNDVAESKYGSLLEKSAMSIGAYILKHPVLYRLAQKIMRLVLLPLSKKGWVRWMPSIPGRWTKVKDLPLPSSKSFLASKRIDDLQDTRRDFRGE